MSPSGSNTAYDQVLACMLVHNYIFSMQSLGLDLLPPSPEKSDVSMSDTHTKEITHLSFPEQSGKRIMQYCRTHKMGSRVHSCEFLSMICSVVNFQPFSTLGDYPCSQTSQLFLLAGRKMGSLGQFKM